MLMQDEAPKRRRRRPRGATPRISVPCSRPTKVHLREIGRKEDHSLAKVAELLLLRGIALYDVDAKLR
jgi:hypothetical protein